MKQKLHYSIFLMFVITLSMNAQNKVWDFGNDDTNFPIDGTGVIGTEVRDGLTLVSGGSTFARVDNNNATWPDGYTSVKRLRGEGSSAVTDGLPTRRYMEIPVDGPVAVKLWFRFSGTSLPRAVVVSDASGTEIMRFDSTGDTSPLYIEADYTGPAGTLLVFQDANATNFYKLEISTDLLNVSNVFNSPSAEIKSVGERIFISNITAPTEVNIYALTGALVKSIKTNSDLDFGFNSGLYLAQIKTGEVVKTVKLIVK
jgi:hypothetical protein